jgi:predicted DNA-binding WGR domain protein
MERYFTFQDENSDKFWTIETKGDELFTTYGKNKKGIKLFSNCQKAEKLFDTDEECEKEAKKLISKKIKEGYLEQEPFFLELYDEILKLHKNNKAAIQKLMDILDQRSDPLNITYGAEAIKESIFYIFHYKIAYNPFDGFDAAINVIYHLPKMKIADTEILQDIYSYGLRIAANINDKKLELFCKEHLPEQAATGPHAVGLAALAVINGDKKELLENIKIAIHNGIHYERFLDDPLFKKSCKEEEVLAIFDEKWKGISELIMME